MSLASWWRAGMPSENEVRAEIWSLGARHHGWPLEGAVSELEDPDVPAARAQLLRACIRELKRR